MQINERSHTTSGAMCHELIAKLAKEIAEKSYDSFASDNTFYKMYPNAKRYVSKEWGRFVPEARDILAKMLGMKHISIEQKEVIADALMLDRTLPKGRMSGIISSLKHANRLH